MQKRAAKQRNHQISQHSGNDSYDSKKQSFAAFVPSSRQEIANEIKNNSNNCNSDVIENSVEKFFHARFQI